jgi:parallel beta-helix repeat protein
LNGDGRPDLAISNFLSNSVSVLLNTTAPGATTPAYAAQTTFATGSDPQSVSIGDLNGDGRPDLAIANFLSDSVSVLLSTTAPGATAPSFAAQTSFATGTGPLSVSIGDVNGDGRPDLAISNYFSNSVSVLLNTTAPGATTPSYATQTAFTTGTNPYSVSIGDFNGDGKPDLAVANQSPNSVSVLMNATTPTCNLTVSSATGTTFAAAVGGTTPLTSVTIASGPTSLGGNVTTTGSQTYTGAVTLAANSTLTGTIPTFTAGVAGNSKNLTLNFSGTTAIDGTTFTGIKDLATGSGGSTTLAGTITTSGLQTYNDAVILTADTTLSGNAASGVALAFKGTVDGAKNFAVLGDTGTIAFDQAVGGTTALASLQVLSGTGLTAAGPLKLDGSAAGARTFGIVISAGVNNVSMQAAGSSIKNYSSSGLFLKGTQNSTISGFTVSGNSSKAMQLAAGDYTGTKIVGNTITGSTAMTYGIFLSSAQNLQVGGTSTGQGNTVTNTSYGLYATGSLTGTTVAGNTISSNDLGIWLSAATSLTVNGANQLTSNKNIGLYASGTNTGTVFQGNTISGNSTTTYGVFLAGAQSLQVGGTSTGQGNTVTDISYGLYATGSLTGTTVAGNTISGSGLGVWLSAATSLTVNGANQLHGNKNFGLYADGTNTGTVFQGNTVNGSSTTAYGVFLRGAQSLQVGGTGGGQGNTITDTGYGLHATGALTGTTVAGNTISSSGLGIWLSAATSLTINGANQLAGNKNFGFYADRTNTGTVFQGNTVNGSSTTVFGVFLTGAQSLQVGGTSIGQANTITATGYGLYAGGTLTGTTVAGNTVSANGTGMWMSGAQGVTVNGGNQFTNNTNYGLYATGTNTGTVFQGNTVNGGSTTKYGLLLTGAQDLQVGGAVSGQGNTITATGYGLYAGGTLTGTTVVGNTISSNGTGIWLSAAQSLTINGANQLTTNTTYGLYATGVTSGTVFQGNTVNGNSTTTHGVFLNGAQSIQVGGTGGGQGNTVTNTGYGLYAGGALTGTTVAANTLSTNGTGIWLNAATGLTINGANQLTKNTTFGFYATGVNTNTVFQGNTVFGSSTTTYGVFLTAAQGLRVGGTSTGQDNTITNTRYGLYAAGTLTGTNVAANTIQSNNNGLYLDAAQGITINNTNRVITNRVFGLFARGLSTGTTVTGNTISGNGTNISTAATTGGTFQTS